MALDVTKPTDNEEISSHAGYIRETREEINDMADTNTAQTDLAIPGGTTELEVGEDLSSLGVEVVNVTGVIPVTIDSIVEGTAGQIKIFIAGDGNVTITNDATGLTGGVIRLNQIPAIGTLALNEGDVLAIVNIGGADGYWREIFRTLYVG